MGYSNSRPIATASTQNHPIQIGDLVFIADNQKFPEHVGFYVGTTAEGAIQVLGLNGDREPSLPHLVRQRSYRDPKEERVKVEEFPADRAYHLPLNLALVHIGAFTPRLGRATAQVSDTVFQDPQDSSQVVSPLVPMRPTARIAYPSPALGTGPASAPTQDHVNTVSRRQHLPATPSSQPLPPAQTPVTVSADALQISLVETPCPARPARSSVSPEWLRYQHLALHLATDAQNKGYLAVAHLLGQKGEAKAAGDLLAALGITHVRQTQEGDFSFAIKQGAKHKPHQATAEQKELLAQAKCLLQSAMRSYRASPPTPYPKQEAITLGAA